MQRVSHSSPGMFAANAAAVARIFFKKLLAASPWGKSDILEHITAELVQQEMAWDIDGLAVYVAGSHDLQKSATVAVSLGCHEKSYAAC